MEKANGKHFEKILRSIYFNEKLAGSLGGIKPLLNAAKLVDPRIKRINVLDFLKKYPTYVDYKAIKRKFPRRRYVCTFKNHIWSSDLLQIDKWKVQNRGFCHIIIAVDMFSR